jgi:hypothetical protein
MSKLGWIIDLSTSVAGQQFFHFRGYMSCRLKFEQHLLPSYYTENKSRLYVDGVQVEHNRFLDALISCRWRGGQIVEDFRIFPS